MKYQLVEINGKWAIKGFGYSARKSGFTFKWYCFRGKSWLVFRDTDCLVSKKEAEKKLKELENGKSIFRND